LGARSNLSQRLQRHIDPVPRGDERVGVIEDCIERLAPSEQALFQVAQFEAALALVTEPTP
jgi:hypothetical protein